MSGQFKVGDICIGQNFIHHTEKNGMECEIIEKLAARLVYCRRTGEFEFGEHYGVRWADGEETYQEPSQLRRKQPPITGEAFIRALFDTPPVERRQPVTAWQAQYDTARALMKMGVRVKPGKWPVEA